MKKLLWTALTNVSPHRCFMLVAQDKSSRAMLERRLKADDPVWSGRVVYKRLPQFNGRHFRRGLAIRSMSRQEVVNIYG